MKVLIVYDSAYSHTMKIAQAIALGFIHEKNVSVKHIEAINSSALRDVETLIIGSSSNSSRPSKNMMKFLESIPKKGLESIAIAAFETKLKPGGIRISFPRLRSDRAHKISKFIDKIMLKKGGIQVLPPEAFFIRGRRGMVEREELVRARDWGREIEMLCP